MLSNLTAYFLCEFLQKSKLTTKVVENDHKAMENVVQYKCNKCGGTDMENLRRNINHYMELKGIKRYSHLLVDIAHELGIKGQKAYEFADREKSNFSKMLKEVKQDQLTKTINEISYLNELQNHFLLQKDISNEQSNELEFIKKINNAKRNKLQA